MERPNQNQTGCSSSPKRFAHDSGSPVNPRKGGRLTLGGWCKGFLVCCALVSVPSAQAFNCLIEPNQTVDVGTPITGLLEQVLVRRADRITQDQVLARLESRAETAATELARFKSRQVGPTQLAQSKIDFARRKFGRRQVMAQEKLMPAQDSDDAEAELRLAEAELKVASENRQIAGLEHRQQTVHWLLSRQSRDVPFFGKIEMSPFLWEGEVGIRAHPARSGGVSTEKSGEPGKLNFRQG
jgi:hypothetical protein